eukprot:4963054-Heterocapsa_arctica.AAC.1
MLCTRGSSQRPLDAQRPDKDADVHEMPSVILRTAGGSCHVRVHIVHLIPAVARHTRRDRGCSPRWTL